MSKSQENWKYFKTDSVCASWCHKIVARSNKSYPWILYFVHLNKGSKNYANNYHVITNDDFHNIQELKIFSGKATVS